MSFSLFYSLPKHKSNLRIQLFLLQYIILCLWLLLVTCTCCPYLCQDCRRRCGIVCTCGTVTGCIPYLPMRGCFCCKSRSQHHRAVGRVH